MEQWIWINFSPKTSPVWTVVACYYWVRVVFFVFIRIVSCGACTHDLIHIIFSVFIQKMLSGPSQVFFFIEVGNKTWWMMGLSWKRNHVNHWDPFQKFKLRKLVGSPDLHYFDCSWFSLRNGTAPAISNRLTVAYHFLWFTIHFAWTALESSVVVWVFLKGLLSFFICFEETYK